MVKGTKDVLFTPVQLGSLQLKHRVIMAPLTRSRSIQPDSVPGNLMKEYYEQRASDGGLIMTEATNISLTSRGWLGAPGLYTNEQVEGWKRIVTAVRAKGGHMFAQLWHTGRSSHTAMTGGAMPVSASVDPGYWQHPSHLVSIPGAWVQPSPHRALSVTEIDDVVQDYRKAAERAMDAGFEGIELHVANGYLVDQFLQNGSNRRTDEYGGSVENRTRFLSEIVSAMIATPSTPSMLLAIQITRHTRVRFARRGMPQRSTQFNNFGGHHEQKRKHHVDARCLGRRLLLEQGHPALEG